MKIKISLLDDDGHAYEGEIILKKTDHDNKTMEVKLKNDDDPLQLLAELCDVSKEKIKKIIDYENKEFIFVGNSEESDFNKKRAIVCQYILTAWMKGKGVEWVESSVLTESLRKLGMTTKNMNRSIEPKKGIFRTDGKNLGLKYSLTIPGWKNGLAMIKTKAEEAY